MEASSASARKVHMSRLDAQDHAATTRAVAKARKIKSTPIQSSVDSGEEESKEPEPSSGSVPPGQVAPGLDEAVTRVIVTRVIVTRSPASRGAPTFKHRKLMTLKVSRCAMYDACVLKC